MKAIVSITILLIISSRLHSQPYPASAIANRTYDDATGTSTPGATPTNAFQIYPSPLWEQSEMSIAVRPPYGARDKSSVRGRLCRND